MQDIFVEINYIFVVDTDSYSGNFERQLTGYMTGNHNDTHGHIEASVFMKECKNLLAANLMQTMVIYHGCACTLWPTTNLVNDGMGHVREGNCWRRYENYKEGYPVYQSIATYWPRKLKKDEIEFLKDRAYKFFNEYVTTQKSNILYSGLVRETPKITGFRLLQLRLENIKI